MSYKFYSVFFLFILFLFFQNFVDVSVDVVNTNELVLDERIATIREELKQEKTHLYYSGKNIFFRKGENITAYSSGNMILFINDVDKELKDNFYFSLKERKQIPSFSYSEKMDFYKNNKKLKPLLRELKYTKVFTNKWIDATTFHEKKNFYVRALSAFNFGKEINLHFYMKKEMYPKLNKKVDDIIASVMIHNKK